MKGHSTGLFTFSISTLLIMTLLSPAPQCSEKSSIPEKPRESVMVQSGTEAVLTLEEALDLALKGNRDIKNASLDVGRGHDGVHAASAARYPKVTLNAIEASILNTQQFNVQKGALGVYPVIGAFPPSAQTLSAVNGSNTVISVEVVQPVTALHKINMAVGAQKAQLNIALQGERGQKHRVVQNVRKAYFEMIDTQNNLETVRESLKFLRDLRRVTGDFFSQGTVLRTDLLAVEAQIENAIYQEKSLEAQVLSEHEQFNVLLGRPLETAFQIRIPDNLQDMLTSPEELPDLQALALKQRPEILARESEIDRAGYQREVERYSLYPDIGAFFSYTKQTNSGLLPSDITLVGFQARWEALDWGRRDSLVAEKAKAHEQAKLQAHQVKDMVTAEVNAIYRRMMSLKALQAAKRASLSSAEENLRVMYNRYQQKMALTKDVLQAEAQAADARRQYQKSMLDSASARAELHRAVGRDL